MALLKYTMPAGLPCYSSWDFPVYPGTFFFYMEALAAAFRQRILDETRFVRMWSSKSGIYKEHYDCIAVLKWLESHELPDDAVVQWDNSVRDLFWSMSRTLVYDGLYKTVECPACNSSYVPRSMQKIEWSYGEDLAAEGGRRLVCPSRHTVYSIMEWNS